MQMNKCIFFLGSAQLFCGVGFCQDLPNLACQTLDEVAYHGSLEGDHRESLVIYRFSDRKLYLSSPTREEYLYGEVIEVESGLWFRSGYKAILFDDHEYETAIIVHADSIETRIIRLRCVKT